MRILMVNKFHYIVGGSETYYFALKRLLEENGHTVIEFSMHDERNIPSDYDNYFSGTCESEGYIENWINSFTTVPVLCYDSLVGIDRRLWRNWQTRQI